MRGRICRFVRRARTLNIFAVQSCKAQDFPTFFIDIGLRLGQQLPYQCLICFPVFGGNKTVCLQVRSQPQSAYTVEVCRLKCSYYDRFFQKSVLFGVLRIGELLIESPGAFDARKGCRSSQRSTFSNRD